MQDGASQLCHACDGVVKVWELAGAPGCFPLPLSVFPDKTKLLLQPQLLLPMEGWSPWQDLVHLSQSGWKSSFAPLVLAQMFCKNRFSSAAGASEVGAGKSLGFYPLSWVRPSELPGAQPGRCLTSVTVRRWHLRGRLGALFLQTPLQGAPQSCPGWLCRGPEMCFGK